MFPLIGGEFRFVVMWVFKLVLYFNATHAFQFFLGNVTRKALSCSHEAVSSLLLNEEAQYKRQTSFTNIYLP